MPFFNKLKNRKIIQWTFAYLAAAWALLQLAQFFTQVYGWPTVILRVLPIVFAFGLLAVIVLAWYHGEYGMQRITRSEILILTVLLFGAGVILAIVRNRSSAKAEFRAAPEAASASVAVLPFDNFSSDPEQAYFSDGITEEILSALAQIPGLNVAARTSSFIFKDKQLPVTEIAKQLNVAHVLQGSVRKAGKRLRISAQLTNARSGFNVWSETFDRDAKDVFAVQDEIARSVANALRVKLGANYTAAPSREILPEAHDEYLLGLAAWNKRTPEELVNALQHFDRATTLQPDYAQAWAGMANTWNVIPVNIDTIPGTDALPRARAAAERALGLNPNIPEAHTALAWVIAYGSYQWSEADKHFEAALELNPNYATGLQWWGETLLPRDPERALTVLKRAVDADPLSRVIWLVLGNAYLNLERYPDAVRSYEHAVKLDATWPNSYRNLIYAHIAAGDSARALATVKRAAAGTGKSFLVEETVARAAFDPKFKPQAHDLANQESNPVRRAIMFGFIKDRAGALRAFERAIATRQTSEGRIVYFPGLKWLRNDRRYQAALRAMKI